MNKPNKKAISDAFSSSRLLRLLLPLLLPIGLLLVLGAVIYCYVEQSIGLVSISLFLLGIIALCFCFNGKSVRNTITEIKWKKVGVFVIALLLSVTFLGSVNYAAHQSDQRWDVTRYKQHTLSQATVDFVKGVDKPVELTAFYVGLPPKYLEDLLKEYQRVSKGKISAKIIDPINDIASAAKFGNLISGKERKLIVVSGAERKDVDFSEDSLSEEQVTNALARVTREPRTAYFLTGHGEYSETNENNDGLHLFAELLSSNNISSKPLMLGVETKIPDDCDVLIIAGPRTALTDQEQGLIQQYLQGGGDALFLIENVVVTTPDKPLTSEQLNKSPSLNGILNEWGINIGTDIVVDLTNHIGGDVGSPATRNYVDHKAITQGLDYTFYIRPRSITKVGNSRPDMRLAPIVLSTSKDKSWAETDRTLKVRFDEGVDILGPVPIAYVIWGQKKNEDSSDTRIITFTDADFLSNAYLNQYSNAAMGINVVNWLAELDYAVFVNQETPEVERLDLTSKQKRMVTALLLLMPLLIALAGLFVWIRP